MAVKGWAFEEIVQFPIYNPTTVTKMPIPEDATPEQIAELERLIEEETKREEESSLFRGS
jgi:hypothetical protein